VHRAGGANIVVRREAALRSLIRSAELAAEATPLQACCGKIIMNGIGVILGGPSMRLAICILLALAVFPPIAARACSCAYPREPLEELALSTAVFSARVTNVELVDDGQRWFLKRVTMALADCWKGALSSSVIVWTAESDAACGIDFQVDSDWLVYAFGSPDALDAGLCSRTQPLDFAAYDLAQLGMPVCTVPVTPSAWGNVKRLYGIGALR
jgi:hypothetical protein